MQFLFDLVDVPVPAVGVIPRVDLSLGFDLVPHCVDDFLLLVRSIQLCDFTRGQQVVDIHQEPFVGDLTLGEEEENIIFLDTSLLIQSLEVSLEIVDAVGGADGDLEGSHVIHRSSQPRKTLLSGTSHTHHEAVAGAGRDDTRDPADMLHCVLEEHQIHDRIVVVVNSKTLLDVGQQLVVGQDIVEPVLSVHAGCKVAENEVFGGVAEVTVEGVSGERFLDQLEHQSVVSSQMLGGNEAISVGTLGFVHPQLDQFLGVLELGRVREEQALEDAGEMT